MLDITPESQMCFWFALVTIYIVRNRKFNWVTCVLYVILCGSLWQMMDHSKSDDAFNRKTVMSKCTQVSCYTLDTDYRMEQHCDYVFVWENLMFKQRTHGKPVFARGDLLELERIKLNNGTQLLQVPEHKLDLPFEIASWVFGITLTLMLLTF